MRPNPQTLLCDIFLRRAEADKTMLVMIDANFEGHPDHIRPDKSIPKMYKDGEAAIKKGYEIFETILKQLKTTNWKFFVHTNIGKRKYIEIMEKLSENKVGNLERKIKPNKVKSLLIFVPSHEPNEIIKSTMKEFLKLGKPICVVDNWGVKRYPRSGLIA